MPVPDLTNRVQRDALIKRDQPAIIFGRQSEQIQVRQQPRTQQMLRDKIRFIAQRQIIRPEFMIAQPRELSKPADQIARREPDLPVVVWIRHDAHQTVFRQRTTRPAQLPVGRPPAMHGLQRCDRGELPDIFFEEFFVKMYIV